MEACAPSGDVLEICAKMGILRVFCRPAARCKRSRHFGVFKGAFRVERAEIEAMKQLSSSWFIKALNNSGVAVSFRSESFGTQLEAWKGMDEAGGRGFKWGLVLLIDSLWKNFPNHGSGA